MSEHAIRKIRRKFMISSMLALFTVMMLMSGMIFLTNYWTTQYSIHQILNYIAENDGDLNDMAFSQRDSRILQEENAILRFLLAFFHMDSSDLRSPEFSFSTRYFAVIFGSEKDVKEIKTGHIEAVSETEAIEYGRYALRHRRIYGQRGNYYYKKEKRSDGSTIVVYLDGTMQVQVMNRLFHSALMLIGFFLCVSFFFVRVFADYALRSELENAELQKQFITNASHELKTPLAVIRANTEMTELLEGESEWTASTLRQVERLQGLIQNLVMITRAQEREQKEEATVIDVSVSIEDTVKTFLPIALQENKTLVTQIPPNVRMRINDSQIRQLCSLLLDNAIKYCDPEGSIQVSLAQRGKGISLTVSNSYESGKDEDYSRFFERFYRQDQSHNVDKGGYGVGLSIAENLVGQYNGKINVNWKEGIISFICILKG
ncbi:MAG: GHKL domain-containing protein [Blautia sp.]|nr:GHKL domain-containing protein [Blautia sp.]